MKTKNNLLGAASFLMISLSTGINAEPSQISLETIKNVDGKRFWQSEVSCNNKTGLRYIEKQVDSDKWCLQLSPTICYSEKEVAANRVCADDYDGVILADNQLTEAIGSTPPSSVVAPTSVPSAQTSTSQPSISESSISESSVPVASVISDNAQGAAEFIEEDDDDDTYFNVDGLLAEKVKLEAELSKLQEQKANLNRRKIELQNSVSAN